MAKDTERMDDKEDTVEDTDVKNENNDVEDNDDDISDDQVEQSRKRKKTDTDTNSPNKVTKVEDTSAATEKNTLYIKNLPFKCTVKDLQDLFVGTTEVRIPKRNKTGKIKGFAMLDFATPEEVTKYVQEKQSVVLNGRTLFLDYDGVFSERKKFDLALKEAKDKRNQKKPEAGETRVLFIKNVSYAVKSDDELKACFADAVAVRFPKQPPGHKQSGKPKGYGFIEFATPEAAQEARDTMNGSEIKGRAIVLEYAVEESEKDRELKSYDETRKQIKLANQIKGGHKKEFVKRKDDSTGDGPKPKKCYKCHENGHVKSNCPNDVEEGVTCHNCEKTGHFKKNCPDLKHLKRGKSAGSRGSSNKTQSLESST